MVHQFNTGTQIFDVTGLAAGDYTFEYELTASAPCLSEVAEFTVTVHPLPNVSAGNDFTICGGDQAILTGSGAVDYSWTGGVVNGQAFTPAATTMYTVTGTDANNCQNTDDVTVNVEVAPTIGVVFDVDGFGKPCFFHSRCNNITVPYAFLIFISPPSLLSYSISVPI